MAIHEAGLGEVERVSREAYSETLALWQERGDMLWGGACGFSILQSPPTFRPPIMIISENGGFSEKDRAGPAHVQNTWPEQAYPDGEQWRFKARLVRVFSEAGRSDLLRTASVTNFLFFKSSSTTHRDGSPYRWFDLPAQVRQPFEEHSFKQLQRLITAMEPGVLLVAGAGVFDRYVADGEVELTSANGKWLMGKGRLFGRSAYGVVHPSSYTSDADWALIAERLHNLLPEAAKTR